MDVNDGTAPAAADARQHDQAVVGGTGTSEGLAFALLAALPDCIKVIGLDGRLDAMSHAGLCAMEVDDWPALHGRPWWDLWPAELEPTLRDAVARAGAGGESRFTAFCPTQRGTPKWWDVTVSPVRGDDGTVATLLSVSRDVTAQVAAAAELEARRAEAEAALERTQLLLGEVHHRIRNNLALVASLLGMQMRQAGDGAMLSALSEAAARVQTVARLHDRLYRTERFERVALQDYLGALCLDLEQAWGGEGRARVATDLAPCEGSVEQAVALGLILAELVANAYRHGDLGPGGRIDVRLSLDGAGRARLAVEDDGRGLPAGFAPGQGGGLGMRIALAKATELGGPLGWGAGPAGGASVHVTLPLVG